MIGLKKMTDEERLLNEKTFEVLKNFFRDYMYGKVPDEVMEMTHIFQRWIRENWSHWSNRNFTIEGLFTAFISGYFLCQRHIMEEFDRKIEKN